MSKRPPVSRSTRGLLQAVCDQPGTRGSTRLVFGEILRAGLMERALAVKPAPQAATKPQPRWRYLPLYDLPQMSDERWELLATSQGQAIELLKDGANAAALLVLQAGTWRNPEEELRQLLIHVQGECELTDEREEEA